jgi:hypothetical protein
MNADKPKKRKPLAALICVHPRPSAVYSICENSPGSAFTIFTVWTLTRITCPTSRTMYCGSSSRFGSLVIPLRWSVQT